MKMNTKVVQFLVPVLSILFSFFIGAILIASIGGNPIEAFQFLFKGAFGTKANIGETIVKATPLIFTGLAATFAYKCGVFNLGAEGQFVMGAVVTIWLSSIQLGLPRIPMLMLSIVAGAVAGGLWGAIPGVLKITRGLNEMIVSIMLNYIAILFMGFLYSGPLREDNLPQTAQVIVKLPRIIAKTRVHVGIVIALVVAFLIYYFMFHTAYGFKLRSVGLNRRAAQVNGFPVKTLMLLSFIVSGAIAGLGGSVELLGTQYRLMAGFGEGFGFDGVAIALIGQLNPIGTLLVAYLFAILRTGATTMQVGTGLPTSVIDIIQALVIVFAVAGSALVNLPKIRQVLANWSAEPKKGQGN
ncbi:MAG: ABC transporter permease [Eubacteriales bacterium]|nr:ABC transporter permease [Eubacteriales bacterium]